MLVKAKGRTEHLLHSRPQNRLDAQHILSRYIRDIWPISLAYSSTEDPLFKRSSRAKRNVKL